MGNNTQDQTEPDPEVAKVVPEEGQVVLNCLKIARIDKNNICNVDGKFVDFENGMCGEASCPYRERHG